MFTKFICIIIRSGIEKIMSGFEGFVRQKSKLFFKQSFIISQE